MKLRSKLLVTHTLVVVLALVLVLVLANAALTRYFRTLASQQAIEQAQALAPALADCYSHQRGWDWRTRRCFLREQAGGGGGGPPWALGRRRMLVADAAGLVLFDSNRLAANQEGQPLRPALKAVAVPITLDGAVAGMVVVEPVDQNPGPAETQFLRLVRRSVILASLVALVLALGIGFVLSGRLTRSLRLLTGAAYRLAHGDRSPQLLPDAGGDEVGELSRAFMTLSHELASAESVRRQMVADIAHELRTPLSVLQLELESIEDGVTSPTPAAIVSLREEVELLNRLVSDLRTLSLADAGQLPLNLAEVAVAQTAERVVQRFQGPARDAAIRLVVAVAPQLPAVRADAARLQQVLGNLLDNALRHTPAGGEVVLSARQDGAMLIWEVRDSGPGFAPDEAQAIFERFYRTDRARARDTGGSGLGLAIVRGLVEAMGGRVWAEGSPGAGAAFWVALPLAA